MNFEYPQKTIDLIEKVDQFMKKHLFSHEKKVYEFSKTNLWENYPELENWKKLAKKEGLWNLFLPSNYGDLSPGLTNLEYAAVGVEACLEGVVLSDPDGNAMDYVVGDCVDL